MKKKFVSIIIATMVSASVMAGCGSVSGNPTEDVMAETQLLEAVRKAAENNSSGAIEEALEAETGEALDIDSLENDMDEVVSEEPERPAMRNAVRIGLNSRMMTTTMRLPTISEKPILPMSESTSMMTTVPNNVATMNSGIIISTPVKKVCKMILRESLLKLWLLSKRDATVRKNKAISCPILLFRMKIPSVWNKRPMGVIFCQFLSCFSCITMNCF